LGCILACCICHKTEATRASHPIDSKDPANLLLRRHYQFCQTHHANPDEFLDILPIADREYANYAPALKGAIEEKEFQEVLSAANEMLRTDHEGSDVMYYMCMVVTLGFSLCCMAHKQERREQRAIAFWEGVKNKHNKAERAANWEYGYHNGVWMGYFRLSSDEAIAAAAAIKPRLLQASKEELPPMPDGMIMLTTIKDETYLGTGPKSLYPSDGGAPQPVEPAPSPKQVEELLQQHEQMPAHVCCHHVAVEKQEGEGASTEKSEAGEAAGEVEAKSPNNPESPPEPEPEPEAEVLPRVITIATRRHSCDGIDHDHAATPGPVVPIVDDGEGR